MHTEISLKFICHDDIAPLSPVQFLAEVKKVRENLNAIPKAQEIIESTLQSRNVTLGKIPKKYSSWQNKLLLLSSEVKKCRGCIKKLRAQLPFLEKSTCVQGFEELSELEQCSYRLKEKQKRLALLINSSVHREALVFHKTIIQKCEAEKKPSLFLLNECISEVEQEITNQSETLRNVDQVLRKSVVTILWETLSFLNYATHSIHPGDKDIEQKIEPLFTLLENIEPLAKKIEDKEPILLDEFYMASFRLVKLRDERYFKQGIYRADLRYPTIYPIIEQMQEVAKGLQQIENDLGAQIVRVLQGDIDKDRYNYQTMLTHLEKSIQSEQSKLYEIAFCTEVHSGLYYAASLLAWIDEIQRDCDFFSEITKEPWLKLGELQQLFNKYLQPFAMTIFPQIDADEESITTLYAIIKSLHTISTSNEETALFLKHKERITKLVITTLSRKATLSLTSDEQAAEEKILSQKALSDRRYNEKAALSMLKQQIKILASKKIINCLYFTSNRFDLLLDLFIATLETHGKYTKYFQGIVDKDQMLQELLHMYKNVTGLESDRELLVQCAEIYQLLKAINKNENKNYILTFFTFCQVQQRCFEVVKLGEGNERWISFFELIKDQMTSLAMSNGFPQLGVSEIEGNWIDDSLKHEAVMFKLLVQALWAKSQFERVEATKAVLEAVRSSKLAAMSMYNENLLKALALQHFRTPAHDRNLLYDEQGLTNLETIYLPLLLDQYIDSPSYWRSWFSVGVMEEALYDIFVTKTKGATLKLANRTMIETEPFFSMRKEVMTNYLRLRQLTLDGPLREVSSNAIECQGYIDQLEEICRGHLLEDTRYHKYMFNALLEEMKKMFVVV